MAELTEGIDVEVAAPVLWATVTDWVQQGRWILATRTRVTRGAGNAVGDEVAATTGVGPLTFTDTMRITRWDPPHECHVRHTGPVLRGRGVFQVTRLTVNRSRFTWFEQVALPLGALGRAGWPLVRPAVALGVRLSLHRLAALARQRE